MDAKKTAIGTKSLIRDSISGSVKALGVLATEL